MAECFEDLLQDFREKIYGKCSFTIKKKKSVNSSVTLETVCRRALVQFLNIHFNRHRSH